MHPVNLPPPPLPHPGANEAPPNGNENIDIPEGLTHEELRELQLENNDLKRQLTEVTVERDDLHNQQARKRRRARTQDPTPDDWRYRNAGKRCALGYMLWVSNDLFEVEVGDDYTGSVRRLHIEIPDESELTQLGESGVKNCGLNPELVSSEISAPLNRTETDALRYQDVGTRLQGNRIDVMQSMVEEIRGPFNESEHFRRVFLTALCEQRRNSAARVRSNGSLIFGTSQEVIETPQLRAAEQDFKDLLGFKPDEVSINRRWPPLAPVLYLDGQVRHREKAFRSPYIKSVFRSLLFGPSSVIDPPQHKGGPKTLSQVLSVKTVTVGFIAAAAVFTRWVISPDSEFRQIGKTTGIDWHGDYEQYKKLLITSLLSEETVYRRNGEVGPFTRLIDEWNTEFFPVTRQDNPDVRQNHQGGDDAPDIEEAIAQAAAFARIAA
ncbi:hypothetical protein FRC09_020897 [Ceratobasidium sp. 395]|nr:hypothetical protein FRC09_020897 [Ceratobasidium sp. 395]